MNIVFFHSSMQAGGAERTIALLSDYAVRHGDTVTIVTLDGQPSFYSLNSAVAHIGLNCSRHSRDLLEALRNNFRNLSTIKGVFRSQQPDHVICFGPNTALLAFLARGSMKYRLVGSERTNPYCSQSGFWRRNKKWISTLCDGYLFQTEGARGYYPASTQRKSVILPNGLVSVVFAANERPWETRKHICAVGRMDEEKCFDDLLSAFFKVHQRHPSVELDLYGDGPLRTKLEGLAASLGLQASVTFHGRCGTMPEEYARHKLFVMASRQEGMPNVLMEALASGCACVAANCDFGPSELIRDGENGFLVPVHDTDAMADRLCRLLEDDALCQSFSKAALSIRQSHSIETVGAAFRTYLNQL